MRSRVNEGHSKLKGERLHLVEKDNGQQVTTGPFSPVCKNQEVSIATRNYDLILDILILALTFACLVRFALFSLIYLLAIILFLGVVENSQLTNASYVALYCRRLSPSSHCYISRNIMGLAHM